MAEITITSNPPAPGPDAGECGGGDNIETAVITTSDIETK